MKKFVITMRNKFLNQETIEFILQEGFTDFRLNMGRFSGDKIISYIDFVKKIADQKKIKISFLLDLPGAKARIKGKDKDILIQRGESINMKFTNENMDEYHVYNGEWLLPELRKRDILQIGKSEVVVNAIKKDAVEVIGLNNAKIKNSESIYIKNREIYINHLTETDLQCLGILLRARCDYVAPSFVTSANIPKLLCEYINQSNRNIKVISKIENLQGLQQINSIMEKSNGIMFGRDDLSRVLSEQKINDYIKQYLKKKNECSKIVFAASSYFKRMVNKAELPLKDIKLIESLLTHNIVKIVINETTFCENWKEIIKFAKRYNNIEVERT